MTNSSYIVPGVVDGDVVKSQAWRRLVDKRSGPEATYVHKHTHREDCNDDCLVFHVCTTTHLPGSHHINAACPEPESESAVIL